MNYTVEELIEALKDCPQDYIVNIWMDGVGGNLMSVGIDHDNKTVDLFE